jgi:hypothetical protein
MEGWKYGIPNPLDTNEYLFSNCPGRLFHYWLVPRQTKTLNFGVK